MPRVQKKWRVTFEVTQWRDKVWLVGEEGQSIEGYQTLELENEYLFVPENAVIEDITPHPPFQDGYYLLAGVDRVQRRKSLFAGVWDEWDGGKWAPSPHIGPTSENGRYYDLTFLGKILPEDVF